MGGGENDKFSIAQIASRFNIGLVKVWLNPFFVVILFTAPQHNDKCTCTARSRTSCGMYIATNDERK
jgi:hypothetical protein